MSGQMKTLIYRELLLDSLRRDSDFFSKSSG